MFSLQWIRLYLLLVHLINAIKGRVRTPLPQPLLVDGPMVNREHKINGMKCTNEITVEIFIAELQ